MVKDLLTNAAAVGDVRQDITPDELASYCLHALAAARTLRSKTAVGLHGQRHVDDPNALLDPERLKQLDIDIPSFCDKVD
jgi:hypothetical protein